MPGPPPGTAVKLASQLQDRNVHVQLTGEVDIPETAPMQEQRCCCPWPWLHAHLAAVVLAVWPWTPHIQPCGHTYTARLFPVWSWGCACTRPLQPACQLMEPWLQGAPHAPGRSLIYEQRQRAMHAAHERAARARRASTSQALTNACTGSLRIGSRSSSAITRGLSAPRRGRMAAAPTGSSHGSLYPPSPRICDTTCSHHGSLITMRRGGSLLIRCNAGISAKVQFGDSICHAWCQ